MKLWYAVSGIFALYQLTAFFKGWQPITALSRTSMAPLVWGWLLSLAVHFVADEA